MPRANRERPLAVPVLDPNPFLVQQQVRRFVQQANADNGFEVVVDRFGRDPLDVALELEALKTKPKISLERCMGYSAFGYPIDMVCQDTIKALKANGVDVSIDYFPVGKEFLRLGSMGNFNSAKERFALVLVKETLASNVVEGGIYMIPAVHCNSNLDRTIYPKVITSGMLDEGPLKEFHKNNCGNDYGGAIVIPREISRHPADLKYMHIKDHMGRVVSLVQDLKIAEVKVEAK